MSQMSLFGGRKQRGRKPPSGKELELHVAVAQTLDRWINRGWRYTHIGHGGFKLPIITAVRLKRMGVKPGWADLILLSPYPATVHFLELKRKGETLSDAQQDFADFCNVNGYAYAWVDDLRSALAQLAAWGAIRVKVAQEQQ